MPRGKPKNKPGAGRPSKKSPELVALLCELFAKGLHVETICDQAGIDESTFYRWFNDDDDFATKIRRAESTAIIELHEGVKKAEPWKILKSRKPKLYSEHSKLEVTGKDGEPIKLIVEDYREPEERK